MELYTIMKNVFIKDVIRDDELNMYGVSIIRLNAMDVVKNINGCLMIIEHFILDYEEKKFLAYKTIDPNSVIEDIPENYLTVTYNLPEENGQTILTVTQGDYATVADGEKRYNEACNSGEG